MPRLSQERARGNGGERGGRPLSTIEQTPCRLGGSIEVRWGASSGGHGQSPQVPAIARGVSWVCSLRYTDGVRLLVARESEVESARTWRRPSTQPSPGSNKKEGWRT